MRRVIKEDLGIKPYVKRTTPNLKAQHKMNRKSFGIWVRESMVEKVLFSDKKYFQFDGIYNRQGIRIYAGTWEEADCKGGIRRKTQHPIQVTVRLGTYFQGVTRPVIIEERYP